MMPHCGGRSPYHYPGMPACRQTGFYPGSNFTSFPRVHLENAKIMKNHCLSVFFVFFLALMALVSSVRADLRPLAGEDPTEVSVGIYIIDIAKVDDVNQTFSVDFHLALHWKDPHFIPKKGKPFNGDKILTLNRVWNPKVLILNSQGLKKHLDDHITITSEGLAAYRQRYSGPLTVPLNLKDFPFDEHLFFITLLSHDYGPDKVIFKMDKERSDISENLNIPDWTFTFSKVTTKPFRIKNQDRALAQYKFELTAKRKVGFYIWKIIFPLFIIVFMSWAVFWINPQYLPAQMGISATSVLTLVVFQYNLTHLLPHISYLTRMDTFVVGASLLIFLALVESVTTSALHHKGKQKLALTVDRYSQILFPVAFGLIVLGSFFL